MPLLVGLAGADWVSEEVSRMRWGRAFTVAYGGNQSMEQVGRVQKASPVIYYLIKAHVLG